MRVQPGGRCGWRTRFLFLHKVTLCKNKVIFRYWCRTFKEREPPKECLVTTLAYVAQ